MLSIHRINRILVRHEPGCNWIELKFKGAHGGEESTVTLFFWAEGHDDGGFEEEARYAYSLASAIRTLEPIANKEVA